MSNNEINEIKIILIGNSGVGKTNLINISIGLNFNHVENTTASSSFVAKEFIINDEKYTANLWDTAGQEAYRGITQLFFRGSEIVILVYDICSPTSFNALEEWYDLCEGTINNEHIYAIIGNKNDLYLESQVKEEDAKKYAESKKAKFKLVSAKEDPESFINFVQDLIINYKNVNKKPRSQSIKINKHDKKNENKNRCCS